ncbi:hypothetical protein HK405_006686, partial [Cladochytrium tenue]
MNGLDDPMDIVTTQISEFTLDQTELVAYDSGGKSGPASLPASLAAFECLKREGWVFCASAAAAAAAAAVVVVVTTSAVFGQGWEETQDRQRSRRPDLNVNDNLIALNPSARWSVPQQAVVSASADFGVGLGTAPVASDAADGAEIVEQFFDLNRTASDGSTDGHRTSSSWTQRWRDWLGNRLRSWRAAVDDAAGEVERTLGTVGFWAPSWATPSRAAPSRAAPSRAAPIRAARGRADDGDGGGDGDDSDDGATVVGEATEIPDPSTADGTTHLAFGKSLESGYGHQWRTALAAAQTCLTVTSNMLRLDHGAPPQVLVVLLVSVAQQNPVRRQVCLRGYTENDWYEPGIPNVLQRPNCVDCMRKGERELVMNGLAVLACIGVDWGWMILHSNDKNAGDVRNEWAVEAVKLVLGLSLPTDEASLQATLAQLPARPRNASQQLTARGASEDKMHTTIWLATEALVLRGFMTRNEATRLRRTHGWENQRNELVPLLTQVARTPAAPGEQAALDAITAPLTRPTR